MKRTLILFTLIAVLVLGALGCLTGCDILTGSSRYSVTDMESFRQTLYESQKSKTATLQNDLTLYTDDDFFNTGAEVSNYTLDGQGHTITIKGDEGGFISSGRHGLFETMKNCTVKNVTIKYDFNAKFTKGSFGGLAQRLTDCTIENVDIIFTRDMTFSGSFFGGITSVAWGCTFNNCSAEVNMSGKGIFAGGFVGFVGSGSMTNCSYSGGLDFTVNDGEYGHNSANDYLGAVGGLAGVMKGSVSACKCEISKLYAGLNTDRWSTVGCDAGGLIGFASSTASVSDCYVDLTEDADLYFSRTTSSLFGRNLRTGLIAGEIDNGAKIKNLYLDASKFTAEGEKFKTNGNKVSFDFGSVRTPNVEGVYIVSGDMFEQHNFTDAPVTIKDAPVTTAEEEEEEEKMSLTVKWEETFGIDGITLTYTQTDGQYSYKEGVFTISENGRQRTVFGAPESVSADTFTSVYSDESLCDSGYYFRITVTLKGETADVVLVRSHLKYANTSNAQAVKSYDEIAFDLGETVIGGSSSGSVWKRDPATGKWVF